MCDCSYAFECIREFFRMCVTVQHMYRFGVYGFCVAVVTADSN